MSHFVAGIIKIIILEAQMGLLLFDRFDSTGGNRFASQRKWGFRILAGLMLLAWCNWGGLRGNFGLVHEWEQFHFYLGAKYQKEVGWFDLYKAAVIADRETNLHAITTNTIRDIRSFEVVPLEGALVDAPRVRAKFSDARWNEFKADWVQMVHNRPIDFNRVVQDHGNSNSPAWAVIAHPIAELLPLTRGAQTLIGLLDMILMAIMFVTIFRTFGEKVGCISLFVFCTPGLVFDYLSGSFLRWDWIFSLGMAVCMMKKERWGTAGAFFGYAVATKLFPIFFGLALGVKALINWQKDKTFHRRYLKFVGGAFASGAAFVVAAAIMFGGIWCWTEYKERIDAARVEKFYAIQYSLQTVYLQFAESSPEEIVKGGWFTPHEVKQALPNVDIANHAFGFLLIRLIFTALVLLLLFRADDIGAFTLGPLLVMAWLIVNMYYWNMLGLMALGLARRDQEKPAFVALVTLHIPFVIFYVYQHLNSGMSEGYAVAFFLTLWTIAFAVMEWREVGDKVKAMLGLGGAKPAVAKG